MSFKKGDVVKLKSGGPHMTIREINNETIYCTWFDKTILKNGNFTEELLENSITNEQAMKNLMKR